MTHGASKTIRTDWFDGPMTKAVAEELAALVNRVDPPKCGRGSGDRPEGAFATRHAGVQTVGVRGCDIYRRRVFAALTLTVKHLVEGAN